MNVRKPAIALAAVALSLGLTACGGGQSVEDACKVANKKATDATRDLSSISPTDPDASAATIEKLTDTLKKTADDLENEEVKKELNELTDQFGELSGLLGDLKSAGTDSAKLQEVGSKLSSLSSEITSQAQDLNKLCNS